MEGVWVREIFGSSVKATYPALHRFLEKDAAIKTCKDLSALIKNLPAKLTEGGIQVLIVTETSGSAEHPEAIAVSNAKDMKLIGGGAFVDYEKGQGNLLTGSYPEGNGWRARAKSHSVESKAKVTAYAIYLHDPFDVWSVKMTSVTSVMSSNRPTAEAALPDDYVLTGGGARVEGQGWGLLLTDCCPGASGARYNKWIAKGKDHHHYDEGTATAWAFGVKPRDGLVSPLAVQVDLGEASEGHRLDVAKATVTEVNEKKPRVIVGGGASVSYRGYGGLLVSSGPSDNFESWRATAKDHQDEDTSIHLKVWVISAVGRSLRASPSKVGRVARDLPPWPTEATIRTLKTLVSTLRVTAKPARCRLGKPGRHPARYGSVEPENGERQQLPSHRLQRGFDDLLSKNQGHRIGSRSLQALERRGRHNDGGSARLCRYPHFRAATGSVRHKSRGADEPGRQTIVRRRRRQAKSNARELHRETTLPRSTAHKERSSP